MDYLIYILEWCDCREPHWQRGISHHLWPRLLGTSFDSFRSKPIFCEHNVVCKLGKILFSPCTKHRQLYLMNSGDLREYMCFPLYPSKIERFQENVSIRGSLNVTKQTDVHKHAFLNQIWSVMRRVSEGLKRAKTIEASRTTEASWSWDISLPWPVNRAWQLVYCFTLLHA